MSGSLRRRRALVHPSDVGIFRARIAGSVLMIGPTHGGRILTVVLNPEPLDVGAWHVRTAWEASTAQISRVAVDPQTLHELEQRAAAQGTDLNAVAADAPRAGAHAA